MNLLSTNKKPSILHSSSRRVTSEGRKRESTTTNKTTTFSKMSFTKTISYFLLSFFILYIYALCKMTNHVLLLHQQQQQQQTTGSFIRRPFVPYSMSSPTIDVTTLSSSETTDAEAEAAAAAAALKTKEFKGRARLRSSIIREAMMNDAKPWTDEKQPLVHIILTRFQQHQGQLKELGMARYYLFETFCLPTIRAQTNQQFLWIIRTDPKLDDSIKLKMKEALQDHPHYLLVESNKRRNETRRFGNVYEFGDILEYDHILSGDKLLAAQYLKAANDHVVIETRLDADDGLHKEFIDIIQTSAKQRFFTTTKNETLATAPATITPKTTSSNNNNNNTTITDITETSTTNVSKSNKKKKKKKKHKGDNKSNDIKEQLVLKEDASSSWVYWCADHHFEWHYDSSISKGDLNFTREMYCITPGMTLGYGPNVTLSEVPKNQHWKLHRQVGPCYTLEDTNCIMHMAHIRPAAIRARTPTSAGMKNVGDAMQKQVEEEEDETTKQKRQHLKDLQWKVLEKTMNVTQAMSTNVNTYLQQHLIDIAIDNLKGQCSVGHSCKRQAKDKLQTLINGGGGGEEETTTSSSSSLLKNDTSTTS